MMWRTATFARAYKVVSTLNPTLIDLFAGAGGLSLGFREAGFRSVFAVEWDKDAAATYAANFGNHCHAGPIQDVREFPAADVIIGGPPCQGFSPLGRDRDDESRHQLNTLWLEYIRVVKQVRPKIFVIENVPEFLKSGQYETFLQTMASEPELADYVVEYRVLNSADYGVPQRRRRGITIASRIGPVRWPVPTHGPHSAAGTPYRTVRDAFQGLPFEAVDPDDREDASLHWGRRPNPSSIERYRAVPEGGNRFDLARNRPDLLPACWANKPTGTTDVFGRLWWDRPSLTIRTEFYKPEKGRYLHPQADRPITHREAARLQTFPDDFAFKGSRIQIARQIGNAVPPDLAKVIAASLLERLADLAAVEGQLRAMPVVMNTGRTLVPEPAG